MLIPIGYEWVRFHTCSISITSIAQGPIKQSHNDLVKKICHEEVVQLRDRRGNRISVNANNRTVESVSTVLWETKKCLLNRFGRESSLYCALSFLLHHFLRRKRRRLFYFFNPLMDWIICSLRVGWKIVDKRKGALVALLNWCQWVGNVSSQNRGVSSRGRIIFRLLNIRLQTKVHKTNDVGSGTEEGW